MSWLILLLLLAQAEKPLPPQAPVPRLAWNYVQDPYELDWYVQIQGQEKKPVKIRPACKPEAKGFVCTTPVRPFRGRVVRVYCVNNLRQASPATNWIRIPEDL